MTTKMDALMCPEYRSSTEYLFREQDADAIVQAASYHRRDFPLSVMWFPGREHLDIHPSISTTFQRSTNTDLGSLGRLPLETLYNVFFHLDMYSLFKFRQTNMRSREAVDSLIEYRMVVSHGLNLFCALLRTRVAIDVTLFDFYHMLCTKACTLCHEFGGFIFLPTWNRCCFKCLQGALETEVQTLASIRKQLHLGKAELSRLRSFKTLPGIYTMDQSVYKSRIAVVSVYQAALALGQPRLQANPRLNEKFRYMGSCALPHLDRKTGKVEHGISCAGCELAFENKIIGSRAEKWASEARNKVYAQDGFLEHFRWCQQAQVLWKSSGEGTKKSTEQLQWAKDGGYFNRRE